MFSILQKYTSAIENGTQMKKSYGGKLTYSQYIIATYIWNIVNNTQIFRNAAGQSTSASRVYLSDISHTFSTVSTEIGKSVQATKSKIIRDELKFRKHFGDIDTLISSPVETLTNNSMIKSMQDYLSSEGITYLEFTYTQKNNTVNDTGNSELSSLRLQISALSAENSRLSNIVKKYRSPEDYSALSTKYNKIVAICDEQEIKIASLYKKIRSMDEDNDDED